LVAPLPNGVVQIAGARPDLTLFPVSRLPATLLIALHQVRFGPFFHPFLRNLPLRPGLCALLAHMPRGSMIIPLWGGVGLPRGHGRFRPGSFLLHGRPLMAFLFPPNLTLSGRRGCVVSVTFLRFHGPGTPVPGRGSFGFLFELIFQARGTGLDGPRLGAFLLVRPPP